LTILGAATAALLLGLAAVQFASDALHRDAAAPGTLPRAIPENAALAVYRALDRIAPAPYFEETLARHALDEGDADAAERYATSLPASPVRDELLARVALVRGQKRLALEYFLAAPDAVAITAAAEAMAERDPAAAYNLVRLLQIRLAMLGTHPDAVAEARWEMGGLANRKAWRQVPGSAAQRDWLKRGLRDYEAAVGLAPLSERYVIADANQADLLGERERARALFAQAVAIDPASAQAIAGLGVVAFENGDRNAAVAYLLRARAIDPTALMVRALERDLK